MSGPFSLPEHLASYSRLANDRELVNSLALKLPDLLLFFESACQDKEWAQQHSKFLRLTLRWAAKQFYLGRLSEHDVLPFAKVIQKHYSLLQPYLLFRSALFFTMKLWVEEKPILVNSLLFGVCSPLLGRAFKCCFEKLQNEWTLPNVPLSIFQHIAIYVSKGKLVGLQQIERAEIIALMEQAGAWEMKALVEDCRQALKLRTN